MRKVAWFSCGIPSALAAKLSNPNVVVRIKIAGEHPDNERFAEDVSSWLGKKILTLTPTFIDHWAVIEKSRFINGPHGARCTGELKKKTRKAWSQPGDINIFGYTAEEKGRWDRFIGGEPDGNNYSAPLIERNISRPLAFELFAKSGMKIPKMYELGYMNNNCVGCVKGGAGYWNKIRKDFPVQYERMARLEEQIGATVLNGESLKELNPQRGREMRPEPCDLLCFGEAHKDENANT